MKTTFNLLTAISISVLSSSIFASSTNNYIIFVDAGSSGSRLHLFQYDNSSSFPVIQDVFSENTKPGLSSFADQPDAAGASLKKLFDDATQYLQKNGIDPSTVPVNVFATAGMRLLPHENQEAIYKNVKQFAKTNYSFPIEDVKTISGRMEGLYGWLDINYLLQNFQNHQPTIGSIDMGGASTQIAFATGDVRKPGDDIYIKLNGQPYTVFSKSFLRLGEDQARLTMMSDATAASCFPQNYAFNQTGIGNFNFSDCGNIYASIIQKQEVAEKIIPTNGKSFIAYSGFYYTYNFFGVDKTPDQSSLESSILNICNETWSQLQTNYPTTPAKYLSTYCADGMYQDNLLYGTYHLQGSQISVLNQINQQAIDWPMGAVLFRLTQNN